jgi:hypothetical protein
MFAQKNNLDTHRRSHTGESPYSCPYCVRRFTQGVNLNVSLSKRFPQQVTMVSHSPSSHTSTAIPERGPTSAPSAPRPSPSRPTSRPISRRMCGGNFGRTGSAVSATARRPLRPRATSRYRVPISLSLPAQNCRD